MLEIILKLKQLNHKLRLYTKNGFIRLFKKKKKCQHYPGSRSAVFPGQPRFTFTPPFLSALHEAASWAGPWTHLPLPEWLSYFLSRADGSARRRCVTPSSPGLSPQGQDLEHGRTVRDQRGLTAWERIRSDLDSCVWKWDKHQHRFPRTNLPKKAGVGCLFSKGVPLVYSRTYTHTHTPPRQHPEQVLWSFSTLNEQQVEPQQQQQQQQQQQCEGETMPSKSQCLRPRLCTLEKGDNGYGFHLHGEKGKTGQFIRLVEPDSPAETSGLRAGDRLVFVNGEDVENESHQQVVSRIRATAGRLELVVVDPDTEQLLKKHNMKCLQEYVTDGVPLPFDEEEEEEEEEVVVEEQQQQEEEDEVVMVEEEDVEVDGKENLGVKEDEVVEDEVEEKEVVKEEIPRESTPVPESNGGIHGHVEKKLSINSEKVSEVEQQQKVSAACHHSLSPLCPPALLW